MKLLLALVATAITLPASGSARNPWNLRCPSMPAEQRVGAPVRPAVHAFYPWYKRGGEEGLRSGPVFLLAETYRLVGHYVGDPQVYRPKDQAKKLRETRDPITLVRARIEIADDEYEELDSEVTEIVEASVEFAKNGTDPAPEDALKNVYA